MIKYNNIVYKATSPSGKLYFGITCKKFSDRISQHKWVAKKGTKTKFAGAIRKYGIDNIKFEIIKTRLSYKLACLYEKYFIKKFDTYNVGYNMTVGGEGLNDYTHTLENVEKMKQRVYKSHRNPEFRERQSQILKDYYKKNPEIAKRNGRNMQSNKDEEKRLIALRSREARIKNSRSNGGRPINCFIYKTKEFIKKYEMIADACRELGVSASKVGLVLKKQRNKTKGYYFEYAD